MKYKKYIKRFLIGLLIAIFLVITSAFIIITFYKKELTATLISSLKNDHGVILKVEDISVSLFSNWPQMAIKLKNTQITSELFKGKDNPFIKAGSIAFSLDVMQVLKKKFIIESITIKDAEINLLKTADGSKNFELKTKSDTSLSEPIKFEISKVSIKNTKFQFVDKAKGQRINIHFLENVIKLKNQQDGMEVKLLGDIKVGGLLFKAEKGAFLKNTFVNLNLDVSVFTKSKSIFIHPPSFIIIDNHSYAVSSFIELNEKKQLMLSIQSENINYKKGVNLLNNNLQKTLRHINVNNPINAKILLISKLGIKQDPIIIVHVSSKNNYITIGQSKVPYSNISFNGSIVSLDSTKQKGNTETAKIIFNNIKGNLYDFPFTASVTLTNFDAPKITIDGNLFINASKINFKPGKEFILKGNCTAKINYSGPVEKLNKKEFLDAPMKLKANMMFNNLSYQEINKPYVYTVLGNANLSNKNLQFENLLLKTEAGDVILKGKVNNFTNYVLGYSNGFKTTLSAISESFNLNPYLTVKTDKVVNTDKTSEENTKAYKKTIEEEKSNFEFDVILSTKKLFIRKVEAANASIKLIYKNKLLDVKSLNLNTCNGKLFAKGTIYDLNKISAEVKIEDVDVNTLFTQFENFGQKAIESKNLQGNIFVDAKFKTDLDNKMEVIGNTMDGEIKLKLINGHLLNFEPLQNISDYVFRNRDFNDISFSELNETCRIKGFEMQIEEMEIGSNVLNLFVSGKYHMKENSNINILIPWSNLKKRGKNYIPKNSGQTADNTKGLKLNYFGPPEKLKLSLGHK